MITCKNGSRRGCKVIRIIGMVLAGLLFAVLFSLAFGLLVQYLWNWLMPALFGFKAITFLQAFALIILSKILFSGFGHSSGRREKDRERGSCGGYFHHRWRNGFSSDERKYFSQFWEKEGKAVFKEYIERMHQAGGGTPSDGR